MCGTSKSCPQESISHYSWENGFVMKSSWWTGSKLLKYSQSYLFDYLIFIGWIMLKVWHGRNRILISIFISFLSPIKFRNQPCCSETFFFLFLIRYDQISFRIEWNRSAFFSFFFFSDFILACEFRGQEMEFIENQKCSEDKEIHETLCFGSTLTCFPQSWPGHWIIPDFCLSRTILPWDLSRL